MLLFIINDFIKNNIYEKFTSFNEIDGIKKMYLYTNGYNARFNYNYNFKDYIILALYYLIALAISIYAAYLSFSCSWNGAIDNIFLKICLALIAFLLGPIYLIWYFFINYLGGLCT